MDEIREHELRKGNFTSSNIAKLMSEPTAAAKKEGKVFGKPALTYIEERNMERELDLPLEVEKSNHNFSWGKCCEKYLFRKEDVFGTEYEETNRATIQHPTIDYWTGTPDCKKHEENDKITAVEIKCPATRKSFMQFYKCNTIEEVIANHDNGEDYFWQTNSHACLLGADFAELFVYMPYHSELEAIKESTQDFEVGELHNYLWIFNALDEELPYLKDGGSVKNIKKFRWAVTPELKERLTNRVLAAGKLLIPRA